MIENYLLLVAEEVRRHLACLGLRSVEDAIGRSDLLGRRGDLDGRASLLGVDDLLEPAAGMETRFSGGAIPVPDGGELGERMAAGELRPGRTYVIGNSDRAVGARLAGALARSRPGARRRKYRFVGTAGQSFGAFLPRGVELELEGQANDYVGKSLSGGRIVLKPGRESAGEAWLAGNTVLYGATSGELFCAGRAGERFAVRNSGATAVVEGTGSNACEYMTSGTVVVLGGVGRNFGAGMTGGEAFVHDPDLRLDVRLNGELVVAAALGDEEAERLRMLLGRHFEHTGSARAHELLNRWPEARSEFRSVLPRADVGRREAAAEGTTEVPDAGRAEQPEAAAA
jgi:glutamate synthase domain-containing protein 3